MGEATTATNYCDVHFGEVTWDEPTAYLRWNGGVLEQAWTIRTSNARGLITKTETEWRPVSHAQPPQEGE